MLFSFNLNFLHCTYTRYNFEVFVKCMMDQLLQYYGALLYAIRLPVVFALLLLCCNYNVVFVVFVAL